MARVTATLFKVLNDYNRLHAKECTVLLIPGARAREFLEEFPRRPLDRPVGEHLDDDELRVLFERGEVYFAGRPVHLGAIFAAGVVHVDD